MSLLVFVSAQKFVALDGGDYANRLAVARLSALNPAEAADANRPGHSDLVRKRQKDFDGRAFLDILGKVEIDTAGTDIAGFGAGFSNRGAGGPADGKGQPHGEALRSAAFRPSQRQTSSNEVPV